MNYDLWTDDELYELAKMFHPSRQFSPPTLKIICMDFTVKHFETWTDFNKKLGINLFDKICKFKYFLCKFNK